MILADTSQEKEFRDAARAWLADQVPEAMKGPLTLEKRVELDRLLAAGRYLGLTWPTEHGGAGLSPVESSLFDEEAAWQGIDMSRSPSRLGISMMGPAMMKHGTEEQKQRFLPGVISVQEVWCQGFSEPDAGSDLAAVRTAAVKVERGYRVNGAKIWTTQAHIADWCLLLVRSEPDAPRHRNLTMLLMNMHQDAVTVSPILDLSGHHEFNEVHLDGAFVPDRDVLGAPGEGWRVAMTTLTSERSYSLRGKYVVFRRQLERLAGLVDGATEPDRSVWLEKLGHVAADIDAVRNLSYRAVSLLAEGESAAPVAPVAHLWAGQAHQRLVELGLDVASARGEDLDYWYRLWLETRAETIYGGAAQVQRNMIAERVLAMPR